MVVRDSTGVALERTHTSARTRGTRCACRSATGMARTWRRRRLLRGRRPGAAGQLPDRPGGVRTPPSRRPARRSTGRAEAGLRPRDAQLLRLGSANLVDGSGEHTEQSRLHQRPAADRPGERRVGAGRPRAGAGPGQRLALATDRDSRRAHRQRRCGLPRKPSRCRCPTTGPPGRPASLTGEHSDGTRGTGYDVEGQGRYVRVHVTRLGLAGAGRVVTWVLPAAAGRAGGLRPVGRVWGGGRVGRRPQT